MLEYSWCDMFRLSFTESVSSLSDLCIGSLPEFRINRGFSLPEFDIFKYCPRRLFGIFTDIYGITYKCLDDIFCGYTDTRILLEILAYLLCGPSFCLHLERMTDKLDFFILSESCFFTPRLSRYAISIDSCESVRGMIGEFSSIELQENSPHTLFLVLHAVDIVLVECLDDIFFISSLIPFFDFHTISEEKYISYHFLLSIITEHPICYSEIICRIAREARSISTKDYTRLFE